MAQFGIYMEMDKVAEAQLSVDPTEINQFDVGQTHARTATEIKLGRSVARNVTHDGSEFEPRPTISSAVQMSKAELARLEAEEEAEDRRSSK